MAVQWLAAWNSGPRLSLSIDGSFPSSAVLFFMFTSPEGSETGVSIFSHGLRPSASTRAATAAFAAVWTATRNPEYSNFSPAYSDA
jgi:hypothetical protein